MTHEQKRKWLEGFQGGVMTTLKTPVTVTPMVDVGTAFLDDARGTIASSWGRVAHAKLQEVARRANLHDELVVKLKHVRHWVENAANRYYDGTQGAAIRQSAQEDLDALDDLLSRAEVKP
jgi:hypothetical protein